MLRVSRALGTTSKVWGVLYIRKHVCKQFLNFNCQNEVYFLEADVTVLYCARGRHPYTGELKKHPFLYANA